MTYRVVVADPPWQYVDGCWDRQKSKAASQYPTLDVSDICKLPVERFASEDSYCFLWITNRHLLEGIGKTVLEAWGFRPITVLTWEKSNLGLGYYLRNKTEHLAFGVKGSPGQFDRKDFPTIMKYPWRKHSVKPHEFYSSISGLTHGPYLELFARDNSRNGWTQWGNEVGDPLGIGFDPKNW